MDKVQPSPDQEEVDEVILSQESDALGVGVEDGQVGDKDKGEEVIRGEGGCVKENGGCKNLKCCPFKGLLDLGINLNSVSVGLALIFSLAVVLYRKSTWIMKMWSMSGEGNFLAKFAVILLFLYIPSFVMWAKELVAFGDLHLINCREGSLDHLCFVKRLCPAAHAKGRMAATERWEAIQRSTVYEYLMKLRVFAKVIYAPWATFIGITVWDLVWIMYVCKGRRDHSCTGSWLGTMLYDFRQEVCYDGQTWYAFCDRFIAYLPIIALTGTTALMGNMIQNRINKRYQEYGSAMNGVATEETSEQKDPAATCWCCGSCETSSCKVGSCSAENPNLASDTVASSDGLN